MVYIQDDLRIRYLQLTVERETVLLRKVEGDGHVMGLYHVDEKPRF